MNNLSWRHHVIPKFYLKGFSNTSGKLYILNVLEDRILHEPKSPKTYFYEYSRNTFKNYSGDLDDFIETVMYNKSDDFAKNAFENLDLKDIKYFDNNLLALTQIIHFINGLFYRIPKFDSYHTNRIINGDASYFLPIFDKNGVDNSFEYFSTTKNDPLYQYLCRFYKGSINMIPLPEEAKKWVIFKLPNEWDGKLCLLTSDSPVIVNDLDLFGSCKEIIVFPLNAKHFIIRTNNFIDLKNSFPQIVNLINLAIVKSAVKHICSPSKEILELYKIESKKYSIDEINNEIFSLLH